MRLGRSWLFISGCVFFGLFSPVHLDQVGCVVFGFWFLEERVLQGVFCLDSFQWIKLEEAIYQINRFWRCVRYDGLQGDLLAELEFEIVRKTGGC